MVMAGMLMGSFSVSNQFGNMLVPNTVMSPTVGFDPDGQAWNSVPQELSTYFSIGDEPACETFGCTDPLASNYDSDATVDDGSCITCEENSVDVTFFLIKKQIQMMNFMFTIKHRVILYSL